MSRSILRMLGRAQLIGLWIAVSAAAQTPSELVLPEALKHLKPVADACSAKDAKLPRPSQSRSIEPRAAQPDLSCAMAPGEVVKVLKRSGALPVDTRPVSEYSAFHVAGAVNAMAAELLGKRYLRNKQVILIGNGKGERALYAECARLRHHGFPQIHVMRGGMPAWLSEGQGVMGHSPDVWQLARLSPAELLVESRFDANLLLLTRGAESMQRHLPRSLLVSTANPLTMQAAIGQWRGRQKDAQLSAIVLVGGLEMNADNFLQLRLAMQPIPLLIYNDTADAFLREMSQREAVWTALARGPKRHGCTP